MKRRELITLLGVRLAGRRGLLAAVTAAPCWLAGMLILLVVDAAMRSQSSTSVRLARHCRRSATESP